MHNRKDVCVRAQCFCYYLATFCRANLQLKNTVEELTGSPLPYLFYSSSSYLFPGFLYSIVHVFSGVFIISVAHSPLSDIY